MKTIDLYKRKSECCGCELCAQSCPKSIIKMIHDEEGFLYPQIFSEEECINCGKCIKVCPIKSSVRPRQPIINAYGGYIRGGDDLNKSASGGFATAISRVFLKNYNGIVYGVSYVNDFKEVKYLRATTLEDIERFRTSKYVQAYKHDVYSLLEQDMKDGKKVLFIGLPCEVSAVYHKLGSNPENLYTLSLICHGPTSQKVHQDYLSRLNNINNSSLTFFSVRYKLKGWKPYYIHAEFSSGKRFNEEFGISDYGIAFQYLKRPSCSSCKYKFNDEQFGLISDMTIGDFHAVSSTMPHFNPMGVSEACVHTSKGEELINIIRDTCVVEKISMDRILTGNRALYDSIPARAGRDKFVITFRNEGLRKACHINAIRLPVYESYYSQKLRDCVRKALIFLHLK